MVGAKTNQELYEDNYKLKVSLPSTVSVYYATFWINKNIKSTEIIQQFLHHTIQGVPRDSVHVQKGKFQKNAYLFRKWGTDLYLIFFFFLKPHEC